MGAGKSGGEKGGSGKEDTGRAAHQGHEGIIGECKNEKYRRVLCTVLFLIYQN